MRETNAGITATGFASAIVTAAEDHSINITDNPIPDYTSSTYADNCINKYCRFLRNSSTVAYVITSEDSSIPITHAMQFSNPIVVEKPLVTEVESVFDAFTTIPEIKTLTNIGMSKLDNDKLSITGNQDDKLMCSRRRYFFEIEESGLTIPYTFYPCSPTFPGHKTFCELPVKKYKESGSAKKKIASIDKKYKAGELTLSKIDILERDKITYRNPDQNTVMGHSAKDEFLDLAQKQDDLLTDEFKSMLIDSANAKLNAKMEGQVRPEWLHGDSYRHTPMADNPQRKDNLAAAKKCHNTEMMILEGVARWFALHVSTADVKTRFKFDMVLDSDVLEHIYFLVIIRIGALTVKLVQEIDTFTVDTQYVKASDCAGLIHILCLMMQHSKPIHVAQVLLKPAPVMLRFNVTLFSPKRDTTIKEVDCQDDVEPPSKKKRLDP